MPQFGSNPSVASQNQSATQDANGNPIISQANNFGASPLGVAARTQALYGIPNANFDLTCADVGTAVTVDNAIPYWSLETAGTIATTMVYNETTQNWSVRMDPTGAAIGDSAILKTRTYLLNDDALALRQKAFASLTRQGTTGTAQWSIVLSATYFDEAGTQLSTYNIGTAADTGTWTGISGVTTSGSAAISTSAAYADIALTLTAAGSVSGTAKVDINSVLIATSQSATGSFLITETFLTSGTFTRPTGVDYVTVVAMGGGGGGQGGALAAAGTTANGTAGGNGGATGPWVRLDDIYVGDVATVSVGVGAGGAGGTANTFSKAAAGTATSSQGLTAGAAGGATTFGSYLSVGGGTATASAGHYGLEKVNGRLGGEGENNAPNSGTATDAQDHPMSTYTSAPFSVAWTSTSAAGSAGTGSGGSTNATGTGGTAKTTLGIAGPGGGGGKAQVGATPTAGNGSVGGAGSSGSGGGGSARRSAASGQTVVVQGGNGADSPVANKGGGGGGGGAAAFAASSNANYNSTILTITSGKGGNGSAGWLIVSYIA
jgi:hypothetical protein